MMYRNHGQIDRGRTNLGQSDQGNIPTLTNPKLAWLSEQSCTVRQGEDFPR